MKIIKDDRFYTAEVEVYFLSELDNTLTYRNLVKDLLVNASKKYPTKQAIREKLDDLYGSTLSVSSTTYGKYHAIVFKGNVLCDKYTLDQENNVQQYLDFIQELIYNPLDFNQNLEEIKQKYIASILRSQEDVASYSMKIALQSATNHPYLTTDVHGDIDLIKCADINILNKTYQNMIENDIVRIYVAGEVTNLTFNVKNKSVENACYVNECNEYHITREKRVVDQSYINMIVNVNNALNVKTYFPLLVLNELLGGNDSLLFNEIREKMGLCYSIFSHCYYYDNVMLIHAGVDCSNIDLCRDAIIHELTKIKNGQFTDEMLLKVKNSLVSLFLGMNDSLTSQISMDLHNELRKIDLSLQEKIKKIHAITKEDVITVAKQLNLIYEYIIEGEPDGKNNDISI